MQNQEHYKELFNELKSAFKKVIGIRGKFDFNKKYAIDIQVLNDNDIDVSMFEITDDEKEILEERKKCYENLKLDFLEISDLQSKYDLSIKYDLLRLDAYGFDILQYKMTEQEFFDLKQIKREKYLLINDFQEKYIFWRENQTLLTRASVEYDQLMSRTSVNISQEPISEEEKERLNKLLIQLDNEDVKNGFTEPQLSTDNDKTFVAKWEIDREIRRFEKGDTTLKNSIDILSFDNYKLQFKNNIKKHLNPKRFINEELKSINDYLEYRNNYQFNTKIPKNPVWKYLEYNGISSKTTTIIDLIYSMASYEYNIDYSILYRYINHHTMPTDYLKLALLITPIQYKIYLETQQEEIRKIDLKTYIANLQEDFTIEEVGFDLGFTDEKLKSLFEALENAKFLHKGSENDFINAFRGKAFKPLKWLKAKTTLTLFIGAIDSFKEQQHKWKKAENIFENVKSDNLRKTYNSQRELDKHKPTNLLFSQILDSLSAV